MPIGGKTWHAARPQLRDGRATPANPGLPEEPIAFARWLWGVVNLRPPVRSACHLPTPRCGDAKFGRQCRRSGCWITPAERRRLATGGRWGREQGRAGQRGVQRSNSTLCCYCDTRLRAPWVRPRPRAATRTPLLFKLHVRHKVGLACSGSALTGAVQALGCLAACDQREGMQTQSLVSPGATSAKLCALRMRPCSPPCISSGPAVRTGPPSLVGCNTLDSFYLCKRMGGHSTTIALGYAAHPPSSWTCCWQSKDL